MSTVATDALVLSHKVIDILGADYKVISLNPFHSEHYIDRQQIKNP